MRPYRLLLLTCCLVGLLLALAPAPRADEPTAEQIRFFETNVRPIFAEHCIKCHGPETQWSNFRLDSRAALLKGGDFGEGAIPGKPEESLLIKAVRQVDEELSMPPKGKLTDRQIADLETWVRQGAPFPAAETAEAQSRYRNPKHWAFQPVVAPPPPAVKDTGWVQSPIDNFILAKLEADGLAPAPVADKRTLIRRATFDLTGLPPTPAEIDAFLQDDHPQAFARVVERLLNSPAYGERWGRHWLDVARYADSNGLDENVAHGNAWRYRDYVINAFNVDKPYREFVHEQIAGDLLPASTDAERREQLVATGFLAIGPKVLAEPDESKMEMDVIDEQLDTLGKAFLGLTLGCARCHDHKFDPIDTADYYALAGVFKSTRTMESFKKVAKWHENVLPDAEAQASDAAHKQQVVEKKAAIQTLIDEATATVKANAKPDETLPEKLEPLFPAETQAQLKQMREALAAFEKSAPEMPTAMGATEFTVSDVAIHIRGSHLKLGDVTPRRVPVVFTSVQTPEFTTSQSGRLELAQWLTDAKHPLTYRVLVNRVWRWHFGKGLVRTPDNFGMLGDAPTHPELLDWLAQRFVEDGTSLKELHRLIMLSSVYQQSSIPTVTTAERDPENRLWGRAEVHRLEAEAVRDALLAVSGELDSTLGGSLLTVKNRAYFFDHTSKDLTTYATARRSVYLPVVRNNLYDVFQLLDFPDAAVTNGDRATTTVAPQALLMLNSDLVAQASSRLAEQIQAHAPENQVRLTKLYALAYGREPSADEQAAGEQFLKQVEQTLQTSEPDATKRTQLAWETLCHVILAANEFIYVR